MGVRSSIRARATAPRTAVIGGWASCTVDKSRGWQTAASWSNPSPRAARSRRGLRPGPGERLLLRQRSYDAAGRCRGCRHGAGALGRGRARPAGPSPPAPHVTLVDAGRGTAEVPGVLPARPTARSRSRSCTPPRATRSSRARPAPRSTRSSDAPPADGEFPLVVFAHGFNGEGWFFRGRRGLGPAGLRRRPAHLPAQPERGRGPADVENQPADISFIIDEIGALPDDDPLAGRVDVEQVASEAIRWAGRR